MALTVLAGLSAGCAPTLEGSGEGGGTIRQNQLRQTRVELGPLPLRLGAAEDNVPAIADRYCGQFGRSAHIARENVGLLWTDGFAFECIE